MADLGIIMTVLGFLVCRQNVSFGAVEAPIQIFDEAWEMGQCVPEMTMHASLRMNQKVGDDKNM